jgi:hypothetical protein
MLTSSREIPDNAFYELMHPVAFMWALADVLMANSCSKAADQTEVFC